MSQPVRNDGINGPRWLSDRQRAYLLGLALGFVPLLIVGMTLCLAIVGLGHTLGVPLFWAAILLYLVAAIATPFTLVARPYRWIGLGMLTGLAASTITALVTLDLGFWTIGPLP